MKIFKRLFFICSIMCVCLVGCENASQIRTASFADITMAGSDNNTIKISFQSDKRVNEKNFDIQVKAQEPLTLTIHKEMESDVDISIPDMKWNSLTTLIVEGKNQRGKEDFETYKDVQSLTYIIKSEKEAELTFRVIVGEKEENSAGTGYILTNSKEISEEFKFNLVKAKTE